MNLRRSETEGIEPLELLRRNPFIPSIAIHSRTKFVSTAGVLLRTSSKKDKRKATT